MAELAQAGHTYADMEREMALKGFDKTTIQDILSTDADNKEKVINLMRGLAQKELVQTLSMKDENTVKGNAKRVDIFGNDVKGPDRLRPPSSSGRLPPKNDSKPSSATGNHGDHPFGGSHEGRGTVLVKPAPKDDGGRHLVEVPDGCSVPVPTWVGDGYCDKSGGYNTEECNWDGGDCCDFTCASGQSYNCGIWGYDCKSCSVDFEDWVGDGYCDRYGGYNTAGCGYDGGDCCEQTCEDGAYYSCGVVGYDCECGPTQIVQAPFPHPGREGPGFRIRNGKR